ncbi:RNA binding protein [Gordonia phage Hibiscus]|uniref:RNA binding protein n=1 Tax=Gordonia phage Jojo24 TaxID=2859476 RepID=A0AAE7SMH1_9CAUD|nr:RNA binding protein [Gordonia phage Jojo24]QXO13100.1 RNA binding protein [Gordonia phage Jojo24]
MWGGDGYDALVVHRRVVLNLKSGRAVAGYVTDRKGKAWVVRDAQVAEPGVDPVAVDGAVVVHRDDVDFVQVPDERDGGR